VTKDGHVQIELDVTNLIGRAKSLCVPILLALDEQIGQAFESSDAKALGLHDLETLVDAFRPQRTAWTEHMVAFLP